MGWWKLAHLALPLPVVPQRNSQEGWSLAVTLAIINIVGTPAQKNTGLGVGKFQFNICLEFSGFLFGLRQYVCPTRVLQRHLSEFSTLNCQAVFKIVKPLSVKVWGEIVSFSTSANGAESRTFYVWPVWERHVLVVCP